MWPSQRASPERSQGHHLYWRCRSATSVYRTVKGQNRVPRVSTDLWSEGLPPSLGLSLSAGQQMLAVPFLLQTPETSMAISQTTRSPEAKLQQKRHRQGTHSMLSSYSGYVPNSRPWISDVSFLLCLLIWGGRLWPTMVQMRRSEDNLQEPPR